MDGGNTSDGTTRTVLRILDDPAGDPAWNMAVDEALLLGDERATLRLYAWRPHAVSLGYFQRRADFADLPPGTRVVRRLTGGGAIHHGDEVTFALVVDADVLPNDVDASYAVVHDALLGAIAAAGVAATRLAGDKGPAARPGERWCFAEPGRHDLVDGGGHKLVGSAQRRLRTARGPRVLHHGSIVVRRPALTPFVAAMADAIDADRLAAAASALRRDATAAIATALGLRAVPGAVTAAESALAARLRRERYDAAAFTDQR